MRAFYIRFKHPILWSFAALALTLTSGALLLYFWLLADLPPVSQAAQRVIRPTSEIVDRNGRRLYEILDPDAGKQINLKLDQLPQACIQATLATEDSRFYSHPGVDLVAIGRALWQNYRAGGDVVSGGSTLTQQVARNLLLPPEERFEQSLQRKVREAWLAWQLERHYTKDELLALYLNQIYYGNFAFGIEAAAQIFFAKPAQQLSRAECALLAGLVQYPTGYNPLQSPETAKARQLTVLRLMREAGYIDQNESDLIAAEPLHYRSALFNIAAPHFVMMIQDQVVQRIGSARLRQGGLRIVTTLDVDLQRRAETAVAYRLDLLNCRTPGLCGPSTDPARRIDNAAAVVLDTTTGDILALVGSPDYFDPTIEGNVNAALALRQPGSAIKPLTYAAAIDPRWMEAHSLPPLTAATILPDLPVTFYVRDAQGGNVPYQPLNYDRRFHGPVTLRTALANSYNIPAVRVLDHIGVETLQQVAGAAGITTFTGEYGLALTLGGGEVRLLDLTTAYGIFQNGRRLDVRGLVDVQTRNAQGEWQSLLGLEAAQPGALPAHRPGVYGAQVISPQAAYLMTDLLADSTARLPAFGANSVLDLPFPAAVKTGTTTDWRDNWTVGYSTQRIVGVWVGNADNTPMLDVSGVDGAGPIWHDLMLAAHPQAPPPFPRPEGIEEVEICAPSGLLPTSTCRRVHPEKFIAGTAPTRPDDQFVALTIDQATGLPADATTPTARQQSRIYWMLPPEYHDWMVSQNIPIAPTAGQRPQPGQVAAQVANGSRETELVLAAPTSNTAYQIHPGVPRNRQRLEVSGFTAQGRPWSSLRLVIDGTIIAEAQNATHLRTWWEITPGAHNLWLEGEAVADGPTQQSEQAWVKVEALNSTLTTAR
jgi:penicillin-binding protein 1C